MPLHVYDFVEFVPFYDCLLYESIGTVCLSLEKVRIQKKTNI